MPCPRQSIVSSCVAGLAACLTLTVADRAQAVDLSIASIEITQGLQSAAGDLPLVARNATAVRVKISLNGEAVPVAGVDAVLRIYSDGIEIAESPLYSTNGPIVAPLAPSSDILSDTVNFLCLPPEGTRIDFVVKVNPFATVVETNYANNELAVLGKQVVCRKMMDLAYVPVDYVPGGGQPNPYYTQPGRGDAFLRGIYKTGDWNYHRSPLPPLVHTLDITISNTFLLNSLLDIRQNQIPAAGYAQPDFVFGWLPGNPYIGNGQALSTPGSVAFGNTDPAKFQRTFAHEIGHCWGQPHNQLSVTTTGLDVERHLQDPLGLAQIMPGTKRDVMVAGLNTADAWVASLTYLDPISDTRAACSAFGDGGGGDGPADDATEVLRIAGRHDHLKRRVELQPAMTHDAVAPTADNPRGNVRIEAFGADGALLHTVRIDTRTCRESCAEPGHLHRDSAVYANLPSVIGGQPIARVVVREIGGRPLAVLERSAHAPVIESFTVARAGGAGPVDQPNSRLEGRIRLDWRATDADGDALIADLLYSPDGGAAWLPLRVGETSGSFAFNSSDVPASRGGNARFAVRVSDGMNTTRMGTGSSFAFGNSQPPDVHLLAPNQGDSIAQGSTVVLHGSAWDIDDQLLPESSVTWTSSIDGPIGTGRLLVRRNLSPGQHQITVRGTDSGGLFTEASVTVTVTPRLFNNGNIDGEGVVDATDLVTLLSDWGGHGLADLDLDGVVGPRDVTAMLIRWGL